MHSLVASYVVNIRNRDDGEAKYPGKHISLRLAEHIRISDICTGTHASLGICVRDKQYQGNTHHCNTGTGGHTVRQGIFRGNNILCITKNCLNL